VFELGTNHPGEIAALAKMVRPDIGVITNVGLGHVEFFGDEAGVAREKGSLLEVLPRNGDGLAVINADDKWCHELRAHTNATVVTVGIDNFADIRASEIKFNGDVKFYVMDAADPVLRVYRKAFPGVFKTLSELPPDLKAHLRYPEDIFAVQANQYKTFHMKDPQVFYNREDLWAAPTETYAGEMQRMEPYYILAKLPGSAQLEYMLMTPFTPLNRDNMISWMAARSDFPYYGKMLFYELPKDKLIYGPNQIEAMINQNTTISQQLTLWNQNGSRVIRGKQIVTPIENSFLYVVPLYLTSAATDFPQLKRVIAIAGDRVVMEATLDEAIASLFGPNQPKVVGSSAPLPPTTATPAVLNDNTDWSQARAQLGDAQQASGQGDWNKFGDAMDKLKVLLDTSPPATRN